MEDGVLISIEDIQKSFGKTQILKGVNFCIYENETLGLVGINGAGKSTLIEIICGVKKASKGEIKTELNLKKDIGYMAQQFCLFSDLTVKENLEYFALIYGVNNSRIEEIISLCGLTGRENLLCKNLSGGYKQLVSLAVSILHSPKILILDEPTSAMDPIFRVKFWDIINKYKNQNNTIFVTTHYLEEINFCDRLLVLNSGKITADKRVDEMGVLGMDSLAKIISLKESG